MHKMCYWTPGNMEMLKKVIACGRIFKLFIYQIHIPFQFGKLVQLQSNQGTFFFLSHRYKF